MSAAVTGQERPLPIIMLMSWLWFCTLVLQDVTTEENWAKSVWDLSELVLKTLCEPPTISNLKCNLKNNSNLFLFSNYLVIFESTPHTQKKTSESNYNFMERQRGIINLFLEY